MHVLYLQHTNPLTDRKFMIFKNSWTEQIDWFAYTQPSLHPTEATENNELENSGNFFFSSILSLKIRKSRSPEIKPFAVGDTPQ